MKKAFNPFWLKYLPIGGRYRNKFSVFLVCIAISFFMWGLIKLTREYETPVKFKLNFENIPEDKVLVSAQDSTITLFLKARGLDLYSRLFRANNNIIDVSLAGIRMRSDGNKYNGYIRTSRNMFSITQQLTNDIDLLGIQPDTLHFTFEDVHTRKVPVKSSLSLSYEPQFQLYDSIHMMPDSVIVSGIKSIIDTIYSIDTEKHTLRNLKGNKTLSLKLTKPKTVPPIHLAPDSITVEITVERFTEATIQVPVGMESKSPVTFRTFPDKVTLTCRVAMREYERLDPSLFSVAIDYEESLASGNDLATVYVTRSPPFAKVIRIQPEKVEYLILK